MSKNCLLGLAVILLIAISSQTVIYDNIPLASAATPTKLKIDVGPSNIPADNSVYDCITVQLQDSKGNPARATQNLTISMSSSLTNIGDVVKSTITIPAGSTFATNQFHTTYSPGKTSITATASGYATVQASVTTVGPIPATLVVYGFPSTLPADGKKYDGTVIVQLQDTSGAPAKAPNEGVIVTLSSSNTEIGMVDSNVVIQAGQTYAAASFTTTTTPGSVSITPLATGYTSKQATFKTQIPDTTPTLLKIFLGPPKVPADQTVYKQIAVELQSKSGGVAKSETDVTITMASSVPEVGTVDQTITVKQGDSYAYADFDSTYLSGTTLITATATDYTTTQQSLTTVGNTPTKLAVFVIPSTLPSDGQSINAIQVQLQDSSGKPAKDPNGDITVNLFSSTPDCGNVASQLTIPYGKTSAQGAFTSTYTANSTTITAQASNYATGQAKITTYLIDEFTLDVSLTPEASQVYPGKNTTITAYVTIEGTQPASNVKLTFNSTKGGNFTTVKYEGNGTYTTIFSTPKSASTSYNITANGTRTGYASTIGTCTVVADTSVNPDETTVGSVKIQITQENGTPISNAQITSISVPTGALALNGITNADGYYTFQDIAAGAYEIQISKEGYTTLPSKYVIVKKGEMVNSSFQLTAEQGFMMWIIIIVAVAAVVSGVAGGLFYRKRQRQKRFKRNQEMGLNYETF